MNTEIKIVYTIILIAGILALAWGIIFFPNFILTFGDLRDVYTALGVYYSTGLGSHIGWDIDHIHTYCLIGGTITILLALLIKGFGKKNNK
jgi:hypothetical protein